MKNVLYNYGDYCAISLSPGLPSHGGTCHFASRLCLKHCSERKHPWRDKAFNLLYEQPEADAISLLLRELAELNTPLLFWFDSGDCLPGKIERTAAMMEAVSKTGIVQNGFTRNEKLVEVANELTNVRLGYTHEGSLDNMRFGLVAVPNYQESAIQVHWNKSHVWNCGWGGFTGICDSAFTESDDDYFETDCMECLKRKCGCFAEFNKCVA